MDKCIKCGKPTNATLCYQCEKKQVKQKPKPKPKGGAKYVVKSNDKNELILAMYCDTCGGEGQTEDEERNLHFCLDCDGYGYTLTEDGSQFLALVYDVFFKGKEK